MCLPAAAALFVRPWLGGEGGGEGEPTQTHCSPARESEEAEGRGRVKVVLEYYVRKSHRCIRCKAS